MASACARMACGYDKAALLEESFWFHGSAPDYRHTMFQDSMEQDALKHYSFHGFFVCHCRSGTCAVMMARPMWSCPLPFPLVGFRDDAETCQDAQDDINCFGCMPDATRRAEVARSESEAVLDTGLGHRGRPKKTEVPKRASVRRLVKLRDALPELMPGAMRSPLVVWPEPLRVTRAMVVRAHNKNVKKLKPDFVAIKALVQMPRTIKFVEKNEKKVISGDMGGDWYDAESV